MTAKRVLRWFLGTLIKGFVVLLPILGTLAIGLWLFGIFESLLGAPLRWGLGTGGPEAKGPWRYLHYYKGWWRCTFPSLTPWAASRSWCSVAMSGLWT